jgi:hypothetical protein
MPYALPPPGYRAVPIGEAARIEDLDAFVPLEESSDEGALFLARLELADMPSEDSLDRLDQSFRNEGVEPWPGNAFFVYADETGPAVYLAWQKGFAWLPVIIGILVASALPPVLMAGIWAIIPDSLKSLISGLVNIGMMYLVVKMIPAPAGETSKRKKAKEAKESGS